MLEFVSCGELWHNQQVMRTTVIPFGGPGWAAKRRLLEQALDARTGAPFRCSDVLLIVPSARLRRTYGRAVLAWAEQRAGIRAVSPPEIGTLHQFLQGLGERRVPRRLINETSRLVLLEGIVKEHLSRSAPAGGMQDIVAPSLSAAAGDMIEELSAAGIDSRRLTAVIADSGLGDKLQVGLLETAYRRYEEVLAAKGLADPAGLLASLAEQFDPSWLDQYGTIVIDGLHHATELQVRVLRKIAATGKAVFHVDAPSPEVLRNCGEHHPLRLTREFLARLGLMIGEPALPPDDGALFLAKALFSDLSFDEAARDAPSPFPRDLRLDSAVSIREEVSHIAGLIKGSLRSGTLPDSIVVAFPSLDEYGPLVEEIFADQGIPFNRALGRQLSTSAVTTSLLSLLQAVQQDLSGPSLLRVFSAPFLKFGERPSLAPALDRLLREQRITGGKERLLRAVARQGPEGGSGNSLAPPVRDLLAALEPLSAEGTAPLSAWMDRLGGLMAWSGISERVALIKGPLNTNLQAFRKLNESLLSLREAGRLFPEYRYTFREWLFLLKKTFMRARFQVPPDDEGGVQVLGLEEAMSHEAVEIYIGGLVDGKFPQRHPQNIFLPEATLEALGVRTLENARLAAAYHFYRLLLSAPTVVLTWPENVNGRPVVPSPFLAELAPLRQAGIVREASGVQFGFRIADSRSVPELAKALGQGEAAEGIEKVLAQDHEGLAAIRAALAPAPTAGRPTSAASAKRTFSVTELDAWLRCPYDHFVTTVLGIEPLGEVSEDLSPMDRGTRVHGILRDFYRQWDRPVTQEDRGAARALLAGLAERAFGEDADTFRNLREKDRFLTMMVERFLDAETAVWLQGFRPAYLEQRIEDYRLDLADGSAVELRATIDRIDVDREGNFVVVDYKTGAYPQPTTAGDQEIFQLPVYAMMAMRSLAGKEPALARPIGLAYYDLSGRTGPRARDVVLFDREVRDDHPAAKPKASPRTAAEFRRILDGSMDKARRAVQGILAGQFPFTPRDEDRCRYCPNAMLCRKDKA